MNFFELQRAVQRHVLAGDLDVVHEVNESAKVPLAIRLGIYSHAYRARLIEGLGTNFPQLQQLLGEDAFADLGLEYIAAHPSTHYSIRWFGSELASFLRTSRPAQPWLAELAEWQWALISAFDAADAQPIDATALAHIEPDQWWTLRFDLHPSLRLLRLQTNAQALYKALADEAAAPPAATLDVAQDWLVWRHALTTRFRSMPVSEARVLQLVQNDATFEDLCEALCEWHEEDAVPAQAASLLKSWVGDGLITAVRL